MKNLDYALLLEAYGSMLTEKQQGVMELYYWEDLSLGEISQAHGITRQAVRDSIKRSEQILSSFEDKLGLAEKIMKCKDIYSEISDVAQKLSEEGESDGLNKISELAKCGYEILD